MLASKYLGSSTLVTGLGAWGLHRVLEVSWFWAFALAGNLVVMGLWWLDKRRSRTGGTRIPEIALHLLSLAGGALGAVLALRLLRHKTRKPSFRVGHLLLLILQGAALLAWALK